MVNRVDVGFSASFAVRPAVVDDYSAFTQLFPELKVDDPIPTREAWAAVIASFTWVAVDSERVVGYVYCQEYEDTGYVRNIVVAPDVRRRGVGRALMLTVADHLRRARAKKFWRLNVMAENDAALALYGALGLRVLHSATALRFPWEALSRLPPTAVGVSCRSLPLVRQGRLERLFGLPDGQLEHARSLGRTVLEAVSGPTDAPIGLAVLDPKFPGAFPFRVTEIEALGALLRAMRNEVPSDAFVNLVAEDDDRLVDRLGSLGATVRHRGLHLKGEL